MTPSSKELKRRARAALEGKYFLAVSLTATATILSTLLTFLLRKTGFAASEKPLYVAFYWILSVIMLLLISLLNAGLMKFIHALCTKERLASGVLFYAFQNQPDTFILVSAFRYLVSLVWFIPAILKYMTVPQAASLEQLSSTLLAVLMLALPALIPAVLFSLPYSQVFYVLMDDLNASPLEVLRKSRQLMKGNCLRLLYIWFSFLHWYLLCFTSAGLGAFWFRPYYYGTMSHFYLNLTGQDIEPEPEDETKNETEEAAAE